MTVKELTPFKKFIYDQDLRLRLIKEYNTVTKNTDPSLPGRRLEGMLDYALKHCPYYRDLHIKGPELSAFPLLSKDIIMDRFNDLISDEKDRFIYRESYTGGSTGEPLHFLNQMDYDPVYQVVLWKRAGYRSGDIILSMDGTKIDEDTLQKKIYWGKKDKRSLPYGGFYLSSLYLNEDNIQLYADYILNLKPDFIRGYPIFIYTIAKYMKDKGLKVNHKMKGVQLTSESSFPYQHKIIEEVFNTKVFMQYGHTECCVFAYTWDDSLKYRTEPLYGHTEILNDKGEHVNTGETGEIVVTSFFNRIMPLIRYRTGDRGEFGGYDRGGVIINRIDGRTQDYLVDKSGNRVMITSLIMAQHCKALGQIRKWQIEQTEKGRINMRIIKGEDFSTESEQELYSLIRDNSGIETDFDYPETLPVTERGKSKLVIQHL